MSHICCTTNCLSRGSVLHTCPPSCAHCIIKQQPKQKQVLCLSCALPTDGIDLCAACAVPPCGPDCACDDCDTHSTSCGPCCECLDCTADQCQDSSSTAPDYDTADTVCPSCTAIADGIHGSGPYCGRVCYLSHY